MGDDLDPDELTQLLGCSPTHAQRKGEVLIGPKSGRSGAAKTGMWRLVATDREPEDLNGQIAELLGRLTPSLAVWRTLSDKFHIDLFCGFFLNKTNEGLDVSATSLKALGDRGIELGMDIYAPTREELEEDVVA